MESIAFWRRIVLRPYTEDGPPQEEPAQDEPAAEPAAEPFDLPVVLFLAPIDSIFANY
jgi:hypothetical protein